MKALRSVVMTLVVLFSVPTPVAAATHGDIGYDSSFGADALYAAFQNLGNGNFTSGAAVTGLDIRLSVPLGLSVVAEIREFDMQTGSQTTGYQPPAQFAVAGEHVYHFDFATPFTPRSDRCYALLFYGTGFGNMTRYGWSTDTYKRSFAGCVNGFNSDNLNTSIQNPALNGQLVDYSFVIYDDGNITQPFPPIVPLGKTYGSLDADFSFGANGSFAAVQNLGNGTFTEGNSVTGVDVRVGAAPGNMIKASIREFDSVGNQTNEYFPPDYLPTVEGDHTYHFDLTNTFIPNPDRCYQLFSYQFFSTPYSSTYFGHSNDVYQASSTGCAFGKDTDDKGVGTQNPVLNAPGYIDYAFRIHTNGATSTATSTPTCTVNCNSSIMFLPGVQGTRLYAPGTPFENRLWEPNNQDDVEDLFLDAQGESIRDDIYVKDSGVIDEIPISGSNIYKSFVDDLDEWKTAEGLIGDYRIVAYDWRLSLNDILDYGHQEGDKIYYSGTNRATSTPYILQELRRLAAESRNGKVTIVAHSNGGLVAKALLKRLALTNDPLLASIDKLILIAVPQTGTPQAIGAALHGYDVALPADWIPFLLDPQTGRAFAGTSPMVYHLLPSNTYQEGGGATVQTPTITFDVGEKTLPFISQYGTSTESSQELKNFLIGVEGRAQPAFNDLNNPSKLSPSLLQYGESIHDEIDTWTPPTSMQVHEIAGWGVPTVGSIRYWTGKECIARTVIGICTQKVPKLLYSPELVIDGDGVVVVPSALAIMPNENVTRAWINLRAANEPVLTPDRDHPDLLEIGQLRELVADLVLETGDPLPLFISSSQPPQSSEERLEFILHSPLHLSARDQFGNQISSSVSDIVGATYRRYGEVQYISVPKTSHPTISLSGFETGSFTLEVREISQDTAIAKTSFTGMPNSTSTKVEMSFPQGTVETASNLLIDYDGNGTTDSSFDPVVGGTVEPVIDIQPPEVLLTVSTSTKRLQIAGIDAISSTTVTSMGDTVIVSDKSGNMTELKFKNTFTGGYLSSSRLLSIRYGTSTAVSMPTSFVYLWNTKTNPAIPVSQTIIVDKQFAIEAFYDAKNNKTRIVVLKKGVPIQGLTVPGLALIKLTTQAGAITYSW